jgi:multiple sugar transport system permease protein
MSVTLDRAGGVDRADPIRERPAGRRKRSVMARKEAIAAYIFISPWIVGAVVFTFGPIVASLYYSFTEYNVLQPAEWVGLRNYRDAVDDDLFRRSLINSLYYAVLYVPLHIVFALAVAMLLNTEVKGLGIWRTLFYLPVVTPVVASAVLWKFILNPQSGIVNRTLREIGLPTPGWTTDGDWLIRSVVIMAAWQAVGGTMVLYLAGLRGIPTELYEAANIDGAGWWSKLRNVTLPLLSPVIFFTLIVSVVSSIQVFAQPRILFGDRDGNVPNAGLTYMMYLFNNAFQYFKMGYASALAWILFVVILVITGIQFWGSRRWVYYEGERR